jgi:molybdopterin-guanine dinucleotide biosynthesis protein A
VSEPAAAVGFVVAGGRSRRMGRDKALMGWGGATLLDHAIRTLEAVCADVRVLSGLQRRYTDRGRAVVVDAAPEAGPLAGLEAALASATPAPVVVLAVDMPFVPPELLRHLADSLAGWDVAVPVIPAGPEPLCAAYGPDCLAPVREALAAGERKMTSFWPKVRVRTHPAEELARFGPPERMFRNLNDPDAYTAAHNGRTR